MENTFRTRRRDDVGMKGKAAAANVNSAPHTRLRRLITKVNLDLLRGSTITLRL